MELGLDGTPFTDGPPSLEWPMHAAVYRARADVRAVVHTHSPYAVARSFDPTDLIVQTEESAYLGIDRIAVAPQAPGGTRQLADAAVAALSDSSGVLLALHGVLGVGSGPREALEVCAMIEHQAIIATMRPNPRSVCEPTIEPRLVGR